MSDACWRAIGVDGDGSCPELARHIHCRNCPVFSEAGRALFERPPPPGYRAAWTEVLAEAPVDDPPRRALLVFRLGREWMAIDATACVDVGDPRPAHPVPHRSRRILAGIVNVRGQLLLCVHLGNLLSVTPDASATPRPRLVVIEAGDRSWAFPVDEIEGVVRFADDELIAAPLAAARAQRPFVSAIARFGERRVGVLDVDAVFEALRQEIG